LGDLGLDSLGLVELAQALEEKSGKAVTDGDLRLEMNVAAVRAFLAQAPASESVGGASGTDAPLWPYTWGRAFRRLSLPLDLLYQACVTRTVVLGGEQLTDLPPRLILAGTHHSFADLPLVRQGLARTPGRRLVRRLAIATGAEIFGQAGPLAQFGVLAFGLYPLQQYGGRAGSLRRLAQLAEAGNAVLIFPQGHHIRPADEQAGDSEAAFRPGVAHLAVALDAAVIPFGLAGTEHLMPPFLNEFKGLVIAKIPVAIRRGPLAIAFGAPLTPHPDEPPPVFTARLQAACFALAREAEAALAKASR
jgi:1-acyl-sn-glycerol-3-phosphate acyltransferase